MYTALLVIIMVFVAAIMAMGVIDAILEWCFDDDHSGYYDSPYDNLYGKKDKRFEPDDEEEEWVYDED